MKNLKINVPEGYEIDKEKSTFENIVFKKKNELPKSWEELVAIDGFRVEASIALAKLSQLRDVYRQGWEPDWQDGELKFCVCFQLDKLTVLYSYYNEFFLSFQDRKTAELFLENFRDLIEQAKPLMS